MRVVLHHYRYQRLPHDVFGITALGWVVKDGEISVGFSTCVHWFVLHWVVFMYIHIHKYIHIYIHIHT